MLCLGIDTSAYTTSLAVIDEKEHLHWESRRLLQVPAGTRGLAQSEAFFQHVQNLPLLLRSLPSQLWPQISLVSVSTRPRPVEGSYMPVFTAGCSSAGAVAAALQVELAETSHQEGHLAAGLISGGKPAEDRFLAVHLSGGTTELLHVERKKPGEFQIEILGATTDLHAGQFIDRIGVALGLAFPAGRELEQLARKGAPGSASLLPSAVKGYDLSFSGVESAAQRMIAQGGRPEDIARAVEGCIVRSLSKMLEKALKELRLNNILLVGGVSSNQYVRSELRRKLGTQGMLYWAEPQWSTDNAAGVAAIGIWKKQNFISG